MVNIAGAIGKVLVGTKSANTAKFVINALKNESKVGSVLAKSNTATTKLSAFGKHIKQINSTTNLGTQKSTQLFNYLPKSAQENFDMLQDQIKKEAAVIVSQMKDQDVKDAFARGEIRQIVALIAYMNSLK